MISDDVKQIALRLVAGGMPIKAAARACQIHHTTIKKWLRPEFAERRRESTRRSIENNSALFCERLKRERREAAEARLAAGSSVENFRQT